MLDASGQALVYVYARETKAEADIAKVLTFDEARRIAVNVAKLPGLLGAAARRSPGRRWMTGAPPLKGKEAPGSGLEPRA